MRILTEELQNTVLCSIDITYGGDVIVHNSILHVKEVCEKYGIITKLYHEKRYCCTDYMVLKTEGYLPLRKVEELEKETGLPISIYYRHGKFITDYDNTYC